MERYKETNLLSNILNILTIELSNIAPSNMFDNGQSLTEPQETANVLTNIL